MIKNMANENTTTYVAYFKIYNFVSAKTSRPTRTGVT